MGESTPELLARLVSNGGKILIVGGGLSNLPREYLDHPKLIIWDDHVDPGTDTRAIPTTVKVIIWSRHIGHALSNRLNQAAARLHALKFPMQRRTEIRALLTSLVPLAGPIADDDDDDGDDEATPPARSEETMAKTPAVSRGAVQAFVAKHIRLDGDWTRRGAVQAEGDRLFAKAKGEGLKTTQASMRQAVGKMLRGLGKRSARGDKTPPPKPFIETTTKVVKKAIATEDDFTALATLIADAIDRLDDANAAIRLVQEHLPKVQAETERLRGLRARLLDMLQ